MTARPVVFQDTETTGLDLEADIWEYAGVRRDGDGDERTLHLFIQHNPAKRATMPPYFHDDLMRRYDPNTAVPRWEAARQIAQFTADAHIVGAVPDFDTSKIARLLRLYDHPTNWHYHLIDVEVMALGWLAAHGRLGEMSRPWDSEHLSRLIGVEPPPESERHTAMGDVRWVIAMYERITEGWARDAAFAAAAATEAALKVLRGIRDFEEWWILIPEPIGQEIKVQMAQMIAHVL